MAKLRTNHERGDSGIIFKVGLFAALLGGLYYLFNTLSAGDSPVLDTIKDVFEQQQEEEDDYPETITDRSYYLPTSTTGQLVEHQFYTLSYSEKDEQPEWVAYELMREKLYQPWVDRSNNYRPDPKIKTKSATPSDYRGSGYDRGHLVPAGDMAFSDRSMSETFYMSNMSPQVRNFNMGIWRELEEQVRDWAKKYKHLYIVCGPVLTEREFDRIGRNIVTVPRKYYKIVLDITEPEFKAIGFIIPNELSDEPLATYAVTVDDIEDLTGIDFFPNLLSEELEAELEEKMDVRRWKFSEKRYQLRVRDWNKR